MIEVFWEIIKNFICHERGANITENINNIPTINIGLLTLYSMNTKLLSIQIKKNIPPAVAPHFVHHLNTLKMLNSLLLGLSSFATMRRYLFPKVPRCFKQVMPFRLGFSAAALTSPQGSLRPLFPASCPAWRTAPVPLPSRYSIVIYVYLIFVCGAMLFSIKSI